mmetsp:Transcript_92695/g.288522  ORF Transcript_92695/g.288522 Transcript_92695/m.288522 type:complete len:420 (-) Transcript_92695:174-1433(-)
MPACLLREPRVALGPLADHCAYVARELLLRHLLQLTAEAFKPRLDLEVHLARRQPVALDKDREARDVHLCPAACLHDVAKLLLGAELLVRGCAGNVARQREARIAMQVLIHGAHLVDVHGAAVLLRWVFRCQIVLEDARACVGQLRDLPPWNIFHRTRSQGLEGGDHAIDQAQRLLRCCVAVDQHLQVDPAEGRAHRLGQGRERDGLLEHLHVLRQVPGVLQHDLAPVVAAERPWLLTREVLVVLQEQLPLCLELLEEHLPALTSAVISGAAGFCLLQHLLQPLEDLPQKIGELVAEASNGERDVVREVQAIAQACYTGVVGKGIQVVIDNAAEESHHGHGLGPGIVRWRVHVRQCVGPRRGKRAIGLVPQAEHGSRPQQLRRGDLQGEPAGLRPSASHAPAKGEVLWYEAVGLWKLQA